MWKSLIALPIYTKSSDSGRCLPRRGRAWSQAGGVGTQPAAGVERDRTRKYVKEESVTLGTVMTWPSDALDFNLDWYLVETYVWCI